MSTNAKLLSVCCLGYRHAPFVRDCITSVWRSDWPEKEIVAMDDGSGDGSAEILEELRKESPCPFTVLRQDNTGNVPANFNRLLKASKGAFVLFTSLDDMQLPGALEARMERLLADENCVFAAHTKCYSLDAENRLRQEATPMHGMAPDCAKALELERTQLHTFYIQGSVFRRDALDAVHAFSENMIGDDIVLRTKIFFYLRAHPHLAFALINEPGFIYRRHAGNISCNVMRQLRLALQYYDKFWKERPYPEMMKRWLLTGLAREPHEKIMEIFTATDRAAKLLLDPDVRNALRENAVRSCAREKTG